MPKMKTCRSAKKRFRYTGTGKIRYTKSCRRHLLSKKSPKRKRSLRSPGLVHEADAPRIRLLLPYDTKK